MTLNEAWSLSPAQATDSKESRGFVRWSSRWRLDTLAGIAGSIVLHAALLYGLLFLEWPLSPDAPPQLDHRQGVAPTRVELRIIPASELPRPLAVPPTQSRQIQPRQIARPTIPRTGSPQFIGLPSTHSESPTPIRAINPTPLASVLDTVDPGHANHDPPAADALTLTAHPPHAIATRPQSSGERDPGIETGASLDQRVSPVYPRSSRELGEQGIVVLEVEVLPDGTVGQVRVVSDPGHRRLVEAAIDAVRRSRFFPATRDGKPVTAWVRVPYRFVLKQ